VSETVRGLVLLASVVLWLPFLRPLLSGDLTLEQGLVRYGCALLLAWTAGSWLTALVRGYTAQTEQRTAQEAASPSRADQQRRVQDRPSPESVVVDD
jgi:hypothetical protein